MIVSTLSDIKSPPLFYQLRYFLKDINCYIKLEGCNIAGSLKLKSAIRMLDALEKNGKVNSDTTIICSSSGNLGIALSILCKERKYPFICVSDLNISPISERYIKLWGGHLIKVDQRDENGGYLSTRIKLIKSMLEKNPNYVFVNQYEDEENVHAHYLTTGYEILNAFKKIDYLFIGAGTTGTLNGCARFFNKFSPQTKIIAVDAVGSVTFNQPPAKRYIPGLGTSLKPKLATKDFITDIIWVKEPDTIRMCRKLLKDEGLFLGGSSGTVLHGVYQYRSNVAPGSTVVAISPDNGDRYLETIYNDTWLEEKFSGILGEQFAK